jgi:predicted neuraminidase
MKNPPRLPALLLALGLALPAAAAIVRHEFIYETAPFPQCHASTIEETPQGLIAAWFGGTKEKHPDVGIWVSRHVSGKWTPPVEVANGVQYRKPDGTVVRHPTWNPVLFQPKSGPLLLFYKAGPTPQTWWGMLTRSTDGGKTWSEPHRLPENILGPIKNRPVQLPNGDILCPTSNETEEKQSRWTVHFERTRDFGRTWERTDPLNDGVAVGAIQPSILFLGGDRLLAIGRSRQDRIFEIESRDAGKTWGPLGLGTLPNPNSGTDALTLRDGRHLIVYNHVPGTPGRWGGRRSPLNVAISQDGRTWQAALVLEHEPNMEFSYPSVIQSKDGLVHVTYTWKRQRVRHAVLDPKKLTGREMKDGQWPE